MFSNMFSIRGKESIIQVSLREDECNLLLLIINKVYVKSKQ